MSVAAAGTRAANLEVDRVSKSYGTTVALDAVSLSVNPSEFVALLGPNGAGKTTLFHLLTGLFVSDAGDIRVLGHDMRRQPVRALSGIGTVFQESTLDLDASVYGNLAFHAGLHGMAGKPARSRIAAELKRVGLEGVAGARCRTLSGGNKRKVELARALLHAPKVLLMDEATVGLDPASRRALLQYVRRLCVEDGLSVLWATHLVDEAESADSVIVLHRGKVIAEGTPQAVTGARGRETLQDAFIALTSEPPPESA
jgi:ABC-2 type transport system ATP-binding protein